MRNALKVLSENMKGELREEKNMLQDKQCTYNVTLKHVSATSVAVEKQCVTYSEGVFVVLGINHAMCMRHTVIPCLPGSTIFFHITS
jgi:hypothetical protein